MLVVDDGHHQQALLGAAARRLLGGLPRPGRARDVHDLADRRVGGAAQETAQPDDADEYPPGADDGDAVDGLDVVDVGLHRGERLLGGVARVHRDELGGHLAADGALRVAEQRGGGGALPLGQAVQQPRGDGRGQLVEQGHAVVGVELGEQPGDLFVLQVVDELALQRRVEGFEDGERLVLREQPEDDGAVLAAQALEDVRDLVGRQGRDERGDRGQIPVVDRVVDPVGELGRVECRGHSLHGIRIHRLRSASASGTLHRVKGRGLLAWGRAHHGRAGTLIA